ncbi:hypothetical protein [Gimesia chilikensis]|nr:hypothetical protein [Gimesia chilikensis]
MKWLRSTKLGNWLLVPIYEEDPNWKNSEEWYKEVQKKILTDKNPKESQIREKRDIEFYLDFAKQRYEENLDNYANIDSKADKVLAFTGSMTAAIFVIIKTTNTPLATSVTIACGCFFLAVVLLLFMRWPKDIQSPKNVKDILNGTGEFDDTVLKLKIIASYHCSALAHSIVCAWKSKVLILSNIIVCLGILFLFLGLFF